MAPRGGWFVRVCTGQTEASGIDLEVGLGGDSSSHRHWRKWTSSQPSEFDFPADLQNVQEVWIKGTADPEDRNVNMCVGYRDHITQKMTFDASEEHETSQGDSDSCDC